MGVVVLTSRVKLPSTELEGSYRGPILTQWSFQTWEESGKPGLLPVPEK